MTSLVLLQIALAKLGRSRRAAALVLVVMGALISGFLVLAPVPLGFAIVVAGAIAWCIWLERHPEPPAR